jgi:4-amino-4-deoxy-L-arabinose transferase-like glycosyltransferase
LQPPRGRPSRLQQIPAGLWLAAILLLSLSLNLWNNDFPLGYHIDEPKKVNFILTGTQDFYHPILMLQTVRVSNALLGLEDSYQVAVLGRTTVALAAVLLVGAFWAWVRKELEPTYSLLACLALAVSPILVVHAHYLKEDVFLSLLVFLALLAYFQLVVEPTWRHSAVFGLAAGLAWSSHYKAFLLLPVFLVGPLLGPRQTRRAAYRRLLPALVIGALAFVAVNYPLLLDTSIFKTGILHDVDEVTSGHNVRIGPLAHFFTFHLRYSLAPGMTLVACLVAVGSVAYYLMRWRTLLWQEKILLLVLGVFHLAIELSAAKPAPDFMRYTLPEIPILVYFSFKGLSDLENRLAPRSLKWLGRGLAAAVILVPLQSSIRLDYYLTRDTRHEAKRWVEDSGQRARFERLAATEGRQGILAEQNLRLLRTRGVELGVVSSFNYDRYQLGARLPNQKSAVYRRQAGYEFLFRYPFIEIQPRYKSFAFSNPVLRIVDLGRPPDLDALLADLEGEPRNGSAGPVLSEPLLGELLGALAQTPTVRSPELYDRLGELVVSSKSLGKQPVGAVAKAVGLRFDGWTYGSEPAGVVVSNLEETVAIPRLRIGCLAPGEDLPISVRIDDGRQPVEETFERRGQRWVSLGEMPARTDRLFLIRADKAWQPGGTDHRRLGVSVLDAQLTPPP